PLTAGYFSKDAIIEAAYVSQNPMAIYAYGTTTIAAALTAFYSWRGVFMTFPGSPPDRPRFAAGPERPLGVLLPPGFLATGAIFAGYPFKDLFIGHNVAQFFGGSLKFAEGSHIFEDMHHIPYLIAVAPTVMMAIGFVIAWEFYIRWPELPVEL